MLLACRLFFLLKSGPGTATVAPPSMLLSMCPPMQPFAKLPVHQREAILQWWSVNPIPLMKKVRSGSPWLRLHAGMQCRAPGRTSDLSPPAASTSSNAAGSICFIPGTEPHLQPSPAVSQLQAEGAAWVGRQNEVRAHCQPPALSGLFLTCPALSTVGAPA